MCEKCLKGLLGRYLFLTGHQILELAAMLGGDDEDARETEITLSEYGERTDEETGETMPAGLYASYTDCPEEGCVHLPPNASLSGAAPFAASDSKRELGKGD